MSVEDPQANKQHVDLTPYEGPAGGWGSVRGMAEVAHDQWPLPAAVLTELARQNKVDGFMCVSCAWAKPAKPHPAEFCEEGAKATIWELTKRRCGPAFFAEHTVTELLDWSDHDLEAEGRLTTPLRYNPDSDHYEPCEWRDAFAEIGRTLRGLDPKSVVFYASGRASLEASYMYGLMARMYGSPNLPDSSNMCHESTSVGLKQAIGSSVGTVVLEDFEQSDCLMFFGQNVGVNSPRMLHHLEDASRRGVPIITFNPLHERGLERFKNPQSPVEMLSTHDTRISSQYYAVRAGGDIAALTGLCKWLIEHDDAGSANLDHAFIADHTAGFEPFAAFCRQTTWEDIERESGLSRDDLATAAETYALAEQTIAIYGMGLTQHRLGVQNVRMLCNLLLLKGNIGKPGAGACPVRGHSNVQGQRTVGITEKPELAPLDRLKELYDFEPPRDKGLATVDACQGVIDGTVKAFIGLGGNFVRAVPDTDRAGLAKPRSDRADRHQAQPRAPDQRSRGVSSAVPGSDRAGCSRERRPDRVDGGLDQPHSRLAGPCRACERRPAVGTRHRRGNRQGRAGFQPACRLGRVGCRLQPGAGRHRGHLPRGFRRFQRAFPHAGRV
jgi:molybdopterin-dependent oxidoreductase alpha subunit